MVQLNGDKMEELDCFSYLRVDFSSDGGMEAGWKHRVGKVKDCRSFEECVELEEGDD